MIKIRERYYMVAYTEAGIPIKVQPTDSYPAENEIEQFANVYQQADYIKIEKRYSYVRDQAEFEGIISKPGRSGTPLTR